MKPKYFYKGESAIEYCRKHPEYKYNHLTKYISEGKIKNPSRDTQEIIDEFFETEHKTQTRIMVNGMSLRSTCFYVGASYDAVIQDLCRLRKRYPKMKESERVSIVLNKYIYNGVQELVIEEPKKITLKLENNDEK